MFTKENGRAQTVNEQTEVITFQFSESKKEIRNVFIGETPYFVGTDVASTLGYAKPGNAISQHCRYALKQGIPHPQNPSKRLQVLVIPESDVYRLIMKSTLPSAQAFEMWVMEEVLPSLRKRGYYGTQKAQPDDFIDARNVSYEWTEINGFPVRTISVDGQIWLSINDVNKALRAATDGCRIAKKLNAKEILAIKIFVFGNTHPSWFTNEKGLSLILSGSRKNAAQFRYSQLSLPFGKGE